MFKKNIKSLTYNFDKLYKIKNVYSEFREKYGINSNFEDYLMKISLEELVAIKLHLSSKYLDNKMNVNFSEILKKSMMNSLILFALFNFKSIEQIAIFLNTDLSTVYKNIKNNNLLDIYRYVFYGQDADLYPTEKFEKELYDKYFEKIK